MQSATSTPARSFVSKREAARATGLPNQAVQRIVREGRIAVRCVPGTRQMVDLQDLYSLIKRSTRPANA
jgi:hypothetical protein